MKALWALTISACLAGTAFAAPQWRHTQTQNQQNQQNPSTWNRDKENAQEKASGISDAVDIVNGPTVENLSGTSATLVWQTNKEAATRVRYGTDQKNPSQHAYEPGGSRDHRVQLSNLQPNTTYHYEIETRGGKDRFKGSFHTPAQ